MKNRTRGKIKRSPYSLTKNLCRLILWLMGWRTVSAEISERRFVLVGAYHTSNWDFIIGYLVMTALGLKLSWVGKHTLFRWPIGPLMRIIGGIPVDRRVKTNFVDQIVDLFKSYDRLVIAIAPEGTRRKVDFWRTGFYFIAYGAGIPVVLGFLDYKDKKGGLGSILHPSGDIEKDMIKVREFYSGIRARHPEKASEAKIRLP